MNHERRRPASDDSATEHAGQLVPGGYFTTGTDRADDRDEFARGALHTPRRYEQPIEDDEDPVMPADDASLNTKI